MLPSFNKETTLPVPRPHFSYFCRIILRGETQLKILLGLVASIFHKEPLWWSKLGPQDGPRILLFIDQQHHCQCDQIVEVPAFSSAFTAEGSLHVRRTNKEHELMDSNTQSTKYLAPQK